ncbi:phosphogluconate dehydrogenase (NAD(+)-dependent, decarboxylating) [Salidesulfovibrio onnuriiensis]|uniref:phosphogluconate dehydrogenase (NAD(+)-dependent, decarboxylating) n=1 Tax=Salidesulfovibrio onnuriiensis TaxID=2583823 RepID=UPI0011C8FE59|nr:decarboxylating 6-phosphogluconate dehydrogenase [Salidesulfovibrio onnuriiensis]
MKIGMIGLGRMGMSMARRFLQGGHEVVALNRSAEKTEQLAEEGAVPVYSFKELVHSLEQPRTVWVMLPAGKPTDAAITRLGELLAPGDTVIDGGNTYYKDDIRRSQELENKDIRYLDAGVAGGARGLEHGYCLMVGGPIDQFKRIEEIFRALAPQDGYMHCGEAGAGHFTKMVHNGIEYGMMQAYAEGFALLEDSPYAETIEFADLGAVWNRGGVIRSWILELAVDAFCKNRRLADTDGYVDDSGEGRWTVQQAVDTGTPIPVLALALFERFSSRRQDDFRNRMLAALRSEFGGHTDESGQ